MLMRKLELENFRQYAGKQTIEFSDDPEKNVTLILGKNTSGKTTLIQAFRWVLYDDCNFDGKKNDQKAVINNDVRKCMRPGDKNDARVALTFEHKGIIYEAVRAYEYRSKMPGEAYLANPTSFLYYYPDGEKKTIKGGFKNLDEILPESLAEYFFFDGEKIAQSRKPEKVKDSINTIMGLTPLEHMIAHLYKGRYNVHTDLSNSMKSDPGMNIIRNKISRAQSNLDAAEDNKAEAYKRYTDASERAENLRVEMESIKDIAEAAAELKRVEDKIESVNTRISKIETDIIGSFAGAMVESMINYVSMDILDSISENDYEDKGIPGMDATAIRYLISRGKCVCGADLANSEECRRELEELLTYLPPESIGTQISRLRKDLGGSEIASDRQDRFETYNDNYRDQLDNIEDLINQNAALADKVKDHRDADTIFRNYETAKKQRDQFHNDEVRYEGVIQGYNKELATLNSQLITAGRADKYNAEISDKIEYVQALYKRAIKEYDESSAGIFDEIQSTLSTVFNSMYHGSRTIQIDANYKVGLTVGGEHLDNSKGLDTVQNFAFIATLLKVAKDRSGLELSSEAYPLAMDAVFSNTDEGHIRNICRELPKLAEQAILAIMDKDWTVASSTLESHVGKKYRINKISETHSELVDVTGAE